MRIPKKLTRLLLFFIFFLPSIALADWSIGGGPGQNTSMKGLRFSVAGSIFDRCTNPFPYQFIEANYIHLENKNGDLDKSHLDGFSLTYNLRLEKMYNFAAPFLEGALGGALFSRKRFVERSFGSKLLFEVKLGAGFRVPMAYNDIELVYKYIHNSNANFGKSNDALNMHFIMLNLWFNS